MKENMSEIEKWKNVRLESKDIEFVQNMKRAKRALSNKERQHFLRVREKVKTALKYLTSMTEHLPENQQERVFNAENVQPFLVGLFSLKSDDVEKRRKRVISLWDAIFRVMDATYGLKLVGKEVWSALTIQRDANLRAVYYATLFRES